MELRALNGTPVEGTGDGSSATNGAGTGATWLSRTGGTNVGDLWTNAGGDFETNVLSNVPGYNATNAGVQKTFASSTGFVAAVQSAVSADEPLNLLLISPTTEAGTNNYLSRFSSDDSDEGGATSTADTDVHGQSGAGDVRRRAIPSRPTACPFRSLGSVSNATGSCGRRSAGRARRSLATRRRPATTVSFGQAGDHVLRLTAWNEFGEVSRDFAAQSVPPRAAGRGHYEARITFNGYDRAEPLTNFPALVGLGGHVFGFDYATFRAPDGGDLRFFSAMG